MPEPSTARAVPTVAPDPSLEERPYLRVVAGPIQGMELELSSERALVIGRGPDADIWVPDGAISRRHCRVRMIRRELEVTDLGSRNGLHVNGTPVWSCRLTENDRLQIATTTVVRLVHMSPAEAAQRDGLLFAATRDPLTRTFNRGYFDERLAAELSFALRHGAPLAVLTLDLDDLKPINDRFGHEAGDLALTRLAERIRSQIRREDLLARIGGDEFAVIARGIGEQQAGEFAERLQRELDAGSFDHCGESISLSASVGVATTPPAAVSNAADLLRIADVSMYRAKRARKLGQSGRRARHTLPLAKLVTVF